MISTSKVIKLLGITIEQKLTFREHTGKAIAKAQNSLLLVQRLPFVRGA